MNALYNTIGIDYSNLRKPDQGIAEQIWRALGNAETILNVGAGAGSYEPTDKQVFSLEPSAEMISQRKSGKEFAVQGVAETLPYADNSFDAVMAVLTVHHWADTDKGLSELKRVSNGPVVVLTFDPQFEDFWLYDYFPALNALDKAQTISPREYEKSLGRISIEPVLIPHDCVDGFLSAYWRRPQAYLDVKVRAAISSFWRIGDLSESLAKLEADLSSGAWEEKYGDLLSLDTRDCGYRLVIAQ